MQNDHMLGLCIQFRLLRCACMHDVLGYPCAKVTATTHTYARTHTHTHSHLNKYTHTHTDHTFIPTHTNETSMVYSYSINYYDIDKFTLTAT